MSADLIKRMREVCKLAKTSHKLMLPTMPPQDAWLYSDVDGVLDKVIAEADAWLASGGKQEPPQDVREAYDAIDRYLRNNLHDVDYAEYSAYLETVFAYTHPAPQESGGWVPVSERLPEDDNGDDLLVRLDSGALCTAWPTFFGSDYRFDGWVTHFGRPEAHGCEVTHWMPLPATPKEGGKS